MSIQIKSQQGSSSFALIASLVVLSLTTLFVVNASQKQNAAITEARQTTLSKTAGDGALNALSRFKSLVATRNDGTGIYIPALYASNYYTSQWQLDRNTKVNIQNADLKTVQDIVIQTGATFDQMDGVVASIFQARKNFKTYP